MCKWWPTSHLKRFAFRNYWKDRSYNTRMLLKDVTLKHSVCDISTWGHEGGCGNKLPPVFIPYLSYSEQSDWTQYLQAITCHRSLHERNRFDNSEGPIRLHGRIWIQSQHWRTEWRWLGMASSRQLNMELLLMVGNLQVYQAMPLALSGFAQALAFSVGYNGSYIPFGRDIL